MAVPPRQRLINAAHLTKTQRQYNFNNILAKNDGQSCKQQSWASKDLHKTPYECIGEGNNGNITGQPDHSLHVKLTREDIMQMATEIYDGTIADVHLSLFGYWIRESDEHYDLARQYIRELGLDQGYNIERIKNTHLRKLLNEIHQARPKCVYGCDFPQGLDQADRTSDSRQHRLSSFLSPVIPRNSIAMSGVGGALKSSANFLSFREPLYAAAEKIQTLIKIPKRGPLLRKRSFSSAVIAKTETLPPSLRAERERAMREAVRSSSLNSATRSSRSYPPDTPDRPAPLTFKSRSSQGSSDVPATTNITRSVSSPVRNRYNTSFIPLPLPRNSVMFQDTASHPLLSSSIKHCFRARSPSSTDDVFGIHVGAHVHHTNDLNDTNDFNDANDFNDMDDLQTYETAAHLSLNTQSQCTSGHSGSNLETGRLLRNKRSSCLVAEPLKFAQAIPLPPRSMLTTHYPEQPLYRPNSTQLQSFHQGLSTAIDYCRDPSVCDGPLEARTSTAHQPPSLASTTAAFPIPPMQNPVGELPMSISRATSILEPGVSSNSVPELYRAVTEAQIREILERTRGQGAQLPTVDWKALFPFERAWREVNEQLLVAIYGRRDVLLTNPDVQYVDCISRVLKDGNGASGWLLKMFQQGEEDL
ncbi:hypothetical protein BKA66DRAFT_567470 [Pyrenochaeta sp. MPI-SDFR-AT-0127]|nr:hypothetical protein BKA66DRAFT_567470 [Pyrenochaeta sp. MPI-SDFR-AT-0127]